MLGGVRMEKTFIFVRELLQSATRLSVSKIPYNKGKLVTFLQETTLNIFDPLLCNSIPRCLLLPPKEDTVYEYILPGGITFLLYLYKEEVYCFGPVLTQPYSRDDMIRSVKQYRFPMQTKNRYLQLGGNLPVIASHTLFRIVCLVAEYLTGNILRQLEQINATHTEDDFWVTAGNSQGVDIVQMRQIEQRYEYSAALTDAVLQGNLSLALHIIGQYAPKMQNPVRNTNPLRNAQNYCIVLNTQLRYALEKSGINQYRLDRLSHEIGLEIEHLKNMEQLPYFFDQVIRRYCLLVQENDYPHLKPLVNLAVAYIKGHLADNLTVKDTAAALTVNANYLSTLFKQEMGMPFIDFVNQERIKQAAALLKHTNLQIQQIASTVGYNNTGYFAKQFLRFYGMSPSHYRREGGL